MAVMEFLNLHGVLRDSIMAVLFHRKYIGGHPSHLDGDIIVLFHLYSLLRHLVGLLYFLEYDL